MMASELSYLVKLLGGRNRSFGIVSSRTLDKVRVSGAPVEGQVTRSGSPCKSIARHARKTVAVPSAAVTVTSSGRQECPSIFSGAAPFSVTAGATFVNWRLEETGA
jgi:hypothetical protein